MLFTGLPAQAANPLDALMVFCQRAFTRATKSPASKLPDRKPAVLSAYEQAKLETRDLKDSTHRTYTIGDIPPEAELKSFLRDPKNWLPERRALQAKLEAEQTDLVRQASKILQSSPLAQANPDTPILVLTRGNSGSGKTYTIKTTKHPFFADLGLKSAMEKAGGGIINPDPLKSRIQKEWEDGEVSVQQVHEESSTIADRLIDAAFKRADSFVIDKRFPTIASVQAIAKRAKELGYRVVMVDLDAPLEDSSRRVLNRPVGGDDPNVPFAPIESGFYEVRQHRDEVSQSHLIDDYFAFTSDSSRPASADPLAWRTKGQPLKVENTTIWHEVTLPGVKEATAKRLYSEILDAMATTLPNEFLLPLREGAPFDSVDPLKFPDTERDFVYRSEFDPPLCPEPGRRYTLALRDYLYETRKGGGDQDHYNLSYMIGEYLNAVWPGIKLEKTFTPGKPDRTPSMHIKITHPDPKVLRQLLSDRKWGVRIDPHDGNSVFIDTRDVSLIEWSKEVKPEREEGIGFNINDEKTPGSVGHEYLKTAAQMDFLADVNGQAGTRRIAKAPILFEVSLEGTRMQHFRDAETARFRHGFSLDEPHAYAYSAKVDVLQAEKLFAFGKPAQARRLAEAALKDWRISSEMIALTMMGLEEPAPFLNRRPSDRPHEAWLAVPMDQNIASSFPKMRFHFHSGQARHRLGEVTDEKIRAELVKTKAWLTELQAENDAVRKRAEELLAKPR